MSEVRFITPLCITSPVTYTRWLFICVTTTVTLGSATNFFNFSVIDTESCIGVRPEAWTSFNSGKEIIPSARTGRVAVRSGSFQTEQRSVSAANAVRPWLRTHRLQQQWHGQQLRAHGGYPARNNHGTAAASGH